MNGIIMFPDSQVNTLLYSLAMMMQSPSKSFKVRGLQMHLLVYSIGYII